MYSNLLFDLSILQDFRPRLTEPELKFSYLDCCRPRLWKDYFGKIMNAGGSLFGRW